MIDTDLKSKYIVKDYYNKTQSNIEKSILEKVVILHNDYSFVENQTYPRPSHPYKELRVNSLFTLYAIIISLRTTLENERKATKQFIDRYHNIDEVIESNIEDIASTINCAGMALKKAKTIKTISEYLKNTYDGNINNLNNKNVSETRERLLKIPGIGSKSADCILLLGFDLPSMVVDTNVFRVISRMYFVEPMVFEKENDVLKIKSFLDENLSKDFQLIQIVHTILLLHGKYICRSKPKCDKCKISKGCMYYKNMKESDLNV